MTITFDYEYDCGGYVYSKTVDGTCYSDLYVPTLFEQDITLVLVCAYIHNFGYPGKLIDNYLHCKFPDIHTSEDMYGGSIYNIYDCHVDGLKDFDEIVYGLFEMNHEDGFIYLEQLCSEFIGKQNHDINEKFSIWK